MLFHSSGKGGAEKALPKLLQALQQRGVTILALLPSRGPVEEDLKKNGIAYRVIRFPRWMSANSNNYKRIVRILWNIFMVLPVAYLIFRWRCDIVYTNTVTVSVGALAAKLTGKPHVWHFREFGYEDYGYRYDIGERLALEIMKRSSALFLANSQAVAKKYRACLPRKRITVVYEGYDQPDISNNDCAILCAEGNMDINCAIVGTLHAAKGQIDAILAIFRLKQENVRAKLYVIGDGQLEYKNQLLALVRQYSLENSVCFLGYLDNPLSIMTKCDALLVCSRSEAFGLVTIEAMSLGKPVIGTGTGGTLELIKDGFNGLLYSPGNHEELAEKIKFLYRHPNQALQMGENGRLWVADRFTEERYVTEVLSALRELVR